MAITTAQQLADLKRAYNEGALEVYSGSRRVRYRSREDMRQIISELEREVGDQPKVERNVRLIEYRKGLSP